MQISWFTVIAQIINFMILAGLLKRYLYKPVLDIVEEREKKIRDELSFAESAKAEAKKEREEYLRKNETFEQQRTEMMKKAVMEASDERGKLLDKAREEARILNSKLDESFREMQENRKIAMMEKTQKETYEILKKSMTNLADASLEEQSVKVFSNKIKELKTAEKEVFAAALLSAGNNPVVVRCAFELSEPMKMIIRDSLKSIVQQEVQYGFNTVPGLICGIELSAGGYKLAWSFSEFLVTLQKVKPE